MTYMTRLIAVSAVRLAAMATLAFCWLRPVVADTITIDTTTAAWTVSGGGATQATPFVIGSGISITSNTFQTGTFVSGGSAANFDGFWTAGLTFSLPADATNVTLNFSGLQADDRAIVELNGNIIASVGIFGPGTGQMVFSDGGGLIDNVSFAGNPDFGSVNSGFILGATNTLLAIVNDTGSGITGNLNDSHSFETIFALSGTISYDVPSSQVPEPRLGMFSLIGGSVLLLARRKLGRQA